MLLSLHTIINLLNFTIMAEEITFKTRMWEKLLTYEQKEKYKNAIKQGYFSD